jgi:hypothetical protein
VVKPINSIIFFIWYQSVQYSFAVVFNNQESKVKVGFYKFRTKLIWFAAFILPETEGKSCTLAFHGLQLDAAPVQQYDLLAQTQAYAARAPG